MTDNQWRLVMGIDTAKRNRRTGNRPVKVETHAEANAETALTTATVPVPTDSVPSADGIVSRSDNQPLPLSAEEISRQKNLAFDEDDKGSALRGTAGRRMAAAVIGLHELAK